jgi:hypothetical protein
MVNCETDLNITIKRVGLSGSSGAAGVADTDVKQYLTEAASWLSNEIDEAIDHTDCGEDEAEAVRNLAAIKCYYQVTGTSSTGWTANIGPVTFSGSPDKVAMLQDLWRMVQAFITRKKASAEENDVPFRAGAAAY